MGEEIGKKKVIAVLHVIRKRIPLKAEPNAGSETVCQVEFGKSMRAYEDLNGWWKAEYKVSHGCKKADVYTGYVRRDLVSTNQVHDLGHLVYVNRTKKTYRTSLIYGGPTVGKIRPGEAVIAIAYCRPFALTSKGWCRCDMVTREENMTENCLVRLPVMDDEGTLKLYMAMVDKAREDYIYSERSRPGIRRWAQSQEFITAFGEVGEQFIRSAARAARAFAKSTGKVSTRYLPKEEIMKAARGEISPGGMSRVED